MGRVVLRDLAKSYGSHRAVDGVSLEIADGEFVVLVGPSGCGKTTTLRLIAGLEEPTGGEILLDGRLVNDLEPRDRNIGLVFQNLALFPHLTVFDNIAFGPRMKKVPAERRARQTHAAAEMVRISHLLGKLPAQLSGGEAQRVALARTLVTDPAVFLFDEPLSNLDAQLRKEMRVEIDRLHKQSGKTFILVTHDQEEAMTLADRIVVMREGRIEQVGSPHAIYHEPATRFVAGFFGSPPMNLVDGAIGERDGRPSFTAKGLAVTLPPALRDVAGAVSLGIRPEHVRLVASGGTAADVALVEPLGKDTLLYLEFGGVQPLVVVVDGEAPVAEGARVAFVLPEDKLYAFEAASGRSAGVRVSLSL